MRKFIWNWNKEFPAASCFCEAVPSFSCRQLVLPLTALFLAAVPLLQYRWTSIVSDLQNKNIIIMKWYVGGVMLMELFEYIMLFIAARYMLSGKGKLANTYFQDDSAENESVGSGRALIQKQAEKPLDDIFTESRYCRDIIRDELELYLGQYVKIYVTASIRGIDNFSGFLLKVASDYLEILCVNFNMNHEKGWILTYIAAVPITKIAAVVHRI
jgi:hypothetical protein